MTVTPVFRPEHSALGDDRYIFSYRVVIGNQSDQAVTLLSRRWLIIDADGERHVVEGDGVVGEQPRIEPNGTYEYSSWSPLQTRWGTMEGSYTMVGDLGDRFGVNVARFYLVAPELSPEVRAQA